jgi:Ca2+-binding RTX toxin-like protein
MYGDVHLGAGNDVFDNVGGQVKRGVVFGFDGADDLRGGDRNDIFEGGAGKDTLEGGAGNDVFRYALSSDGRDVIRDWGAVSGNNDHFEIDASGFGGDLVAGAPLTGGRFRLRATSNEAVDDSDRFIFRDRDDTLWFDVDGKGGDEPVLIADLQAGSVITAADILLV